MFNMPHQTNTWFTTGNFNKKFSYQSLLVGVMMVGGLLWSVKAYAAVPTIISAKITSPNTVTVVYSEPVNSTLGDYITFTGSLAGKIPASVSGSGTNIVTLNFNSAAFTPSASGSMVISPTTVSVSDGLPITSAQVTVLDGQTPAITSIAVTSSSTNPTSTLAKAGDTISLNFSFNENVNAPAVSIAGHPVSASGSGQGPYISTYVMATGDPDPVPFVISFTDLAGNSGATARVTVRFNLPTPSISSIVSNANVFGALKIGSSIVFTLTPSVPDPALKVLGVYNGQALTWQPSSGGSVYLATYTVVNGQADQTTPLQISGVTITDASGNISNPATGSDIVRTIDANAPLLYEVTPPAETTTSPTPSYTFSSSEVGTVSYTGDCSSANSSTVAGSNTVTFNTLGAGWHNNCSLTVTDAAGNISSQLNVLPFKVTILPPAPVVTPTPSTPAKSTFKFTRQLLQGSQGADVKQLQQRLVSEGLLKATPITKRPMAWIS